MSSMDVALGRDAQEEFFTPPTTFKIIDLTVTPRPPVAGEPVTVTATGENLRDTFQSREAPVIIVPEGGSATTVGELQYPLEGGTTGKDSLDFEMPNVPITIQVLTETTGVTPQPPQEDGDDFPITPRQAALGAGALGVGALGWVALQRSGR